MNHYNKLRARMYECGVTQKELSRLVSRSQVYFSDRMNGKAPWTLDEVYALAHKLDIPAASISLYFPDRNTTF